MRIELLQLPERPPQHKPNDWRRFFDFASVTNVPYCVYDSEIEGHFARLGAWEEAKAAVLVALASKLLPGRVAQPELKNVAEGRQSEDAFEPLGLAIHSGTTRSIQRALVVALDRARNCTNTTHPTLLTTDFEYPGIITAIDEIWDGPVFVAQLKALLYSESSQVPDLFARAVRVVRPDVIYISHVDRYTGFVFPWDVLSAIAGEGADPPIVVIDGAQAVGNIDLRKCFQLHGAEGPHLYAASAHKFLCALPTLGLLIALRADVEKWELEDKAVAYSLGQGARGTGSIESMASLARSAYSVLGEPRSAQDAFLRGLAKGPWTVLRHGDGYRSGLFQISTKDRRVALRLRRLLSRKSASVGYHISSLSGKDQLLVRGIRRRNERAFLKLIDDDWSVAESWRNDVSLMEEKCDVPESYRVSIHPRLHSEESVRHLCDFLNDPRSWRDREFTRFEKVLAARIEGNRDLWSRLIRRNVQFVYDERFPAGPWGATYHATCRPLIEREGFESSGRDRKWGEGGVANTYYALRGLRPHLRDVGELERELAEHWADRIGPLRRIVGPLSSTRPKRILERWRHACFAYLACVESEESSESSALAVVKSGQEEAIRQWIAELTAKPEEELRFSEDDWPFGGLCVLHRVLRDLDPDSRAEDLVMDRLGRQLVAGADGIKPNGKTPDELGPIFLSSVHAFATLVDGRILEGSVRREYVNKAINSLCQHVASLTTPPRFTDDGPTSVSAAFAALSLFMWPWMDDVWGGTDNVPPELVAAVDDLIAWIENNFENHDVYTDVWSEFHASFLALDVVQACKMGHIDIDDPAITESDDSVTSAIRKHCESVKPPDGAYNPTKDPRIFARGPSGRREPQS